MELSLRSRLVLTLTIFSMFFGAGNLIFPPFLAAASGDGFIPAFIGFCLTAIGLPITALVAVERADGLGRLTGRIHPAFSIIYTVAIYLAIGPCLAIPRTASTSYEMVGNAFGLAGTAPRAIYSLIFFAAASLTAMRPEKLTKTLGRITCPLLILLIAALAIGSAAKGYGDVPATASDAYASAPFATGFQEGYQTMDAIAALVFGMVAALNIKAMGVTDRKQLRRTEAAAGMGAALIFIAVYAAIAFIGRVAASHGAMADNGADILSAAAGMSFGRYGMAVLSMIFIVACFNTCTGLLSSCGVYFSGIAPWIPYRWWVIIFSSVSFLISNIGLTQIIAVSSPVLSLLYPVAIVLILLAFIDDWQRYRLTHILPAAAALVFSFLQVALPAGMQGWILLSSVSLSWVIPSLAAAAIGFLIDRCRARL